MHSAGLPLPAMLKNLAKFILWLMVISQPLVCDLVDWARTCCFSVMAAGRGHKWMPHYRFSTPETIWEHWGLSRQQAERGRLNPKMFNAFLDGSKPAIESAAIANACELHVSEQGLSFPSGSIDDIPQLMRPKESGGILDAPKMVEVVSSLTPDGESIAYDIRKGVWVCIEADTDYIRNCFEEYKITTDDTGRYSCLYKRWHMIRAGIGHVCWGNRCARRGDGCSCLFPR